MPARKAKRKTKATPKRRATARKGARRKAKSSRAAAAGARLAAAGLTTEREKTIGQHIGYRYDVNLLPDHARLTPFLKTYIELMGWHDLNWLEDVHMGYEEGEPAVFDRNVNGWVRVPKGLKLPAGAQDRDMLARELLIRFQMSRNHPLVQLRDAYMKF